MSSHRLTDGLTRCLTCCLPHSVINWVFMRVRLISDAGRVSLTQQDHPWEWDRKKNLQCFQVSKAAESSLDQAVLPWYTRTLEWLH